MYREALRLLVITFMHGVLGLRITLDTRGMRSSALMNKVHLVGPWQASEAASLGSGGRRVPKSEHVISMFWT
jgi:hypothetical protein